MTDQLRIIIDGDYTGWEGFNEGFNINDLNIIHTTRSFLGIPPKEVKQLYFVLEGNEKNIELFVKENAPLCLKVEFPKITNPEELLAKLGEPSFTQDYYLDVALVKNGELVYLEKGISLFVDPTDERRVIYRIKLFSPCSREFYVQNISEEIRLPEEF